ncbi:hypothetical protein M409DRAFT_25447 [Zasmidium cellare ATCC 36951]|uniref:Uncharacterized protein n=1 Tax=Zasmidium cellare ATCC 36951 TaxID=1080233 RepID=A0A6A6CD18_ZASCE|nr:uncharacterized protein M409DRAFT_25447 [Zasmidium cellare ATCC 36951]KAF2164100.1 hypothetical protein M409DRAFT_25447 [Zasmidium cellare ATCC 36951]
MAEATTVNDEENKPEDSSTKDTKPVAEILLNWFIQVTGLTAAVVFGVFSVLSWTNSRAAKEQANTANLLSFASICAQIKDNTSAFLSQTQDLCDLYSSATISALESYLNSSLPLPSSPSNPSGSGSARLSTGAIVGIVVGLSCVFVIVPVTFVAVHRLYSLVKLLQFLAFLCRVVGKPLVKANDLSH